jgi:mannitol-1-phosphate 5-dehydrogenase
MNSSQNTIVIVGAGRIGRGFVGDLFGAAGYRLVLVDIDRPLVDGLRTAGRYTLVRLRGAGQPSDTTEVTDYTALHTSQEPEIAGAIARADLLAVAVFPQDFADVARELAPGLLARDMRRPDARLDLLLCANIVHPGPLLRTELKGALSPGAWAGVSTWLGIVETVVPRIVPELVADPDAPPGTLPPIRSNGYPNLFVDRTAFKGQIPDVPGLVPVDDLRAQEALKIYTYNTFHASLAYLGALRGYTLAAECLADPGVRAGAQGALEEAARAVQAEYGFEGKEMARWAEDVMRYTNLPGLGDTVRRHGADPRRKLRREDRLIGPLRLAWKHGQEAPHLVRVAAAALRFDVPGDPTAGYVREQVAALGVEAAVRELCGLGEAEADLIAEIVRAYAER